MAESTVISGVPYLRLPCTYTQCWSVKLWVKVTARARFECPDCGRQRVSAALASALRAAVRLGADAQGLGAMVDDD